MFLWINFSPNISPVICTHCCIQVSVSVSVSVRLSLFSLDYYVCTRTLLHATKRHAIECKQTFDDLMLFNLNVVYLLASKALKKVSSFLRLSVFAFDSRVHMCLCLCLWLRECGSDCGFGCDFCCDLGCDVDCDLTWS